MYSVLLVDDEPIIKKTLRKLLLEDGRFVSIREAEDGQAALEMARLQTPDLLITDITMPVMDGLELVRHLSDSQIACEKIILSGYDDFGYAQQALKYGVSSYLLKPLSPEELYETLDRIEARFESQRQERAARSKWLPLCRTYSAKLADAIWLLDEAGVDEQVGRYDSALLEIQDGDPKAAYDSLLSMLRLELDARAEAAASELPVPELREVEPERLATELSERLKDVMAVLARQRFVGRHKGIEKALAYMHTEYRREDLSIQEVMDAAGMLSKAHFSRTFKDETGTLFSRYLLQLRLNQACRLLADPNQKAQAAAHASGFSDYASFNRAFTQTYGCTPSEFRNRRDVE
ncbi:response regulator [Paenibacillus koleovorans]|uniref:response regulator n=1 Tax=Paenibacillus koleovorans TaxID=121608 RepID=UPI000FD8688C|nr:response regulator [Paenibacillus koleovorans]